MWSEGLDVPVLHETLIARYNIVLCFILLRDLLRFQHLTWGRQEGKVGISCSGKNPA